MIVVRYIVFNDIIVVVFLLHVLFLLLCLMFMVLVCIVDASDAVAKMNIAQRDCIEHSLKPV